MRTITIKQEEQWLLIELGAVSLSEPNELEPPATIQVVLCKACALFEMPMA